MNVIREQQVLNDDDILGKMKQRLNFVGIYNLYDDLQRVDD